MRPLACLLLIIGGLCIATVHMPVCPHEATIPTSPPTTSAVALDRKEPTQPDSFSRLSALHPELRLRLLNYRQEEGDGHRGRSFYNLTAALNRTLAHTSSRPGEKVQYVASSRATTIEVLAFLGLPELGFVAGQDAIFVYHFQTYGAEGPLEVAIVGIDDGVLVSIGYNGADAIDFSKFTRYEKWSDLLEINP